MHADKKTPPPITSAPAGLPSAVATEPAGATVSETLARVTGRLRDTGFFTYKLLGVVVLVAVAVFAWRFIAGQRVSATSTRWTTLERATSLEALEEIAKADPSGPTAKIAELHEARYRLGGPDGIDAMQSFAPDKRKKAVENVEKARESFLKLADVFKNDLTLKSQCLFGAAKAEETLIGITKDGKGEPLGTVKRAVELYEQLAGVAGATPMGDQARKDAEVLKQKAKLDDLTKLQDALNGRLTTKPTTDMTLPSSPGAGFNPGSIPGLPGFDLTPAKPTLPPAAPTPTTPKAETPAAVVPPTPPAALTPAPKEPAPAPKAVEPKAPAPPAPVTPPAPPPPAPKP